MWFGEENPIIVLVLLEDVSFSVGGWVKATGLIDYSWLEQHQQHTLPRGTSRLLGRCRPVWKEEGLPVLSHLGQA